MLGGWPAKVNFSDPFSNSENPKIEAKTTKNIHSGY